MKHLSAVNPVIRSDLYHCSTGLFPLGKELLNDYDLDVKRKKKAKLE
jgi:hypothetical protein